MMTVMDDDDEGLNDHLLKRCEKKKWKEESKGMRETICREREKEVKIRIKLWVGLYKCKILEILQFGPIWMKWYSGPYLSFG